MRDFTNFRPLEENESRIIHTTLNQLSSEIILFLEKKSLKLFCLVLIEEGKQLVYLLSEKLQKIIKKFQNNEKITSAGLFIGFIKRNTFFLSLEGAEFFLNQILIPDQMILNVSKKAEKSILYGNPIIKRMILNCPSNLEKNTIMLVLNELRELIALARSEINYANFKLLDQGEIAAINLIDKGYYLRRKQ